MRRRVPITSRKRLRLELKYTIISRTANLAAEYNQSSQSRSTSSSSSIKGPPCAFICMFWLASPGLMKAASCTGFWFAGRLLMGFWLAKGAGTGTWWAGTAAYWPMVVAGAEGMVPPAASAAWLLAENRNITSIRNQQDKVIHGHVRPQWETPTDMLYEFKMCINENSLLHVILSSIYMLKPQ